MPGRYPQNFLEDPWGKARVSLAMRGVELPPRGSVKDRIYVLQQIKEETAKTKTLTSFLLGVAVAVREPDPKRLQENLMNIADDIERLNSPLYEFAKEELSKQKISAAELDLERLKKVARYAK